MSHAYASSHLDFLTGQDYPAPAIHIIETRVPVLLQLLMYLESRYGYIAYQAYQLTSRGQPLSSKVISWRYPGRRMRCGEAWDRLLGGCLGFFVPGLLLA